VHIGAHQIKSLISELGTFTIMKKYNLLIAIYEKVFCNVCNSEKTKKTYKPLQSSNGEIYKLTKEQCLKYIDTYLINDYKIVEI